MRAGASASVQLSVTAADTAVALGSGDVPVLATPRVLALAEEATVRAVQAELDDGQTTVGTQVTLAHLAATPVGRVVRAEATLSEVDGRRLVFAVSVHEGATLVAQGTIERIMVDRQRFLNRVAGQGTAQT
jgi:predicted thioesterase